MAQTFNYPFNLTSSTASTFSNVFIPTNATIGNVFYNNLTAGNFVANNINLGISSFFTGSFNAANNISSPTTITNLIFNASNISYFEATITIVINISGPTTLNAGFVLKGNHNASGWSITPSFVGDNTGITFSIDNTGQIYYTSTNIINYTSSVFRYSVQQFSANGNYSSILANTFGNYTLGTVQITSTQDSIPGVNVGALQVLGGVSIGKELLIGGTQGNSFFNTQGQLGINNTIPNYSLDVTGYTRISSGGLISTTFNTNTLGNLYTIGGNVYISGGNLGINTSSPSFFLDVSGGSRFISITSGSIYSTSGIHNILTVTNGSLNAPVNVTLGNLYTSTGNTIIGILGTKGTLLLQNNINTSGHMLNSNTVGSSITTDLRVINKRLRTSRGNANNAISTWNTRSSAIVNCSAIVWSPDLSIFAAVANNSGSGSFAMSSPDGINWTVRNSTSPGVWSGICWSSELLLFVAVSNTGTASTTAVMTSSDGITWTSRTTPSATGYYGVCWSSEFSLFVATSYSNNYMTSPDGVTWTQYTQTSMSGNGYNCWSPELNLFVMANYTGVSGLMWTSNPSGNNAWNTVSFTGLGYGWIAVCWSPELYLFVAVGNNTTSYVATSSDGKNWTLVNTGLTAAYFTNVIWSNDLSLFVAVGSVIWTSSDGIKWILPNTPVNYINGICWSPELSIFTGIIYTTANVVTSLPVLPNSKNTFISNQISVNNTNGSLILQNRITSVGNMISNTNTIGSLITTDLKVMNKRLRTSRGNALNALNTWTTRTAVSKQWFGVCWSPELNLFVAVANDSGTTAGVMSSSDGINWIIGVSGSSGNWISVCWSSELSLFVAVSALGSNNTAWIMTSTTGTGTWTQASGLTSSSNWIGVCWSPELSIFVAVSNNGNSAVSTNGTTWVVTATSGMTANRVKWSAELGMFVCANQTSTSGFMYSFNGTTWNTVSLTGVGQSWYSIEWSPELYLWVGVGNVSTSNIATSVDGINWVLRNTGLTATNHYDVCWSPELSIFIIAGASTTNVNWSSYDGINWVIRNTNPGQSVGICWSPELSIFCSPIFNTSSVVTSNKGLSTVKNTVNSEIAQWVNTGSGSGLFLSGTQTTIPFPTTNINNSYLVASGANNTTFTYNGIGTAYYSVQWSLGFGTNNSGTRWVALFKNGSGWYGGTNIGSASTTDVIVLNGSYVFSMVNGDYITLVGYQSSGSTLNLAPPWVTSISFTRIS